MALNVVSNFAANVAQRNLAAAETQAASSLAKLSSGSRVVSAKDDAASLAIGSRLSAEVAALGQAGVNAGQASSLLQIADGAMARVNDVLTRMKTLAVQAASGQLGSTERGILDTEFQALRQEIARIGNDTEFNGVKLVSGSQSITGGAALSNDNGVDAIRAQGFDLGGATSIGSFSITFDSTAKTFVANDGTTSLQATVDTTGATGGNLLTPQTVTLQSTNDATFDGSITFDLSTAFDHTASLADQAATIAGSSTTSFTFKVGTGAVAAEDNLTFSIDSIVAVSDALSSNDITTASNADAASAAVTTQIDSLNSARATVGANQSRLDFASANVATAQENAEAARSQLLDLNVAQEITSFTSKQILVQAGVSMLAQANQLPQNLLRLFQ